MQTTQANILILGCNPESLQPLGDLCNGAKLQATIVPDVKLALEQGGHCELLVCDLEHDHCIPAEPFKQLAMRWPDTPLILITANAKHTHNTAMELLELDVRASWHILERPFQDSTFTGLIREILALEDHESISAEAAHGSEEIGNRDFSRRVEHSPIRFSYEQIRQGSRLKTVTHGFLTDVGRGGIGILTNRTLPLNQYVSFENNQFCGTGRVAWSAAVDQELHKVGIRFC